MRRHTTSSILELGAGIAALITILSFIVYSVRWIARDPILVIGGCTLLVFLALAVYVVLKRRRWAMLVNARESIDADAWLFVYGSLLEPESFERTIGRRVEPYHYKPAKLRHYVKRWGAPVRRINMIRDDDRWSPLDPAPPCLSLEIEKVDSPEALVFGALVPVSDYDLSMLDWREQSYYLDLVKDDDVAAVALSDLDGPRRVRALMRDLLAPGWRRIDKRGRIRAFVKKPGAPVTEPATSAQDLHPYVRKRYLDAVLQGHRRLLLPNDLPEKTPHIADVFDADAEFAKRWANAPAKVLVDRSTALHRRLRQENCLRNGIYGEGVIRTIPRPVILSASVRAHVARIAEVALTVCSNTLDHVLADEELLAACRISPREAELAAMEKLSSGRLPQISRVDFIVNRDSINVLEINCDSPAGMAHYDALADWYRDNRSRLRGRWPDCDFPRRDAIKTALVQAISRRWQEARATKDPPAIAIVEQDWSSKPARSEFETFKSHFGKWFDGDPRSSRHVICNPAELTYDQGRLFCRRETGDLPIDVVYKRILWKELIERENEDGARDLLQAYRENNVCLVNSLRARLMGNKRFLTMMQDPDHQDEAWKGIDNPQRWRPHFPEAVVFDDDSLLSETLSREGRKKYVLKSFRGFAAKEVIVGTHLDADEWTRLVRSAFEDGHYIRQEVHSHGRMHVPMINTTEVTPSNFVFIVGAYLVDGVCVGIEAKASQRAPVSMNPPHSGYRTIILSPSPKHA